MIHFIRHRHRAHWVWKTMLMRVCTVCMGLGR